MIADLSLPQRTGIHIAFTGIDGSGKTTQAGKLAHHIRERYGPTYLAEPRTDFVSQLLHVLASQHGKTSRREYFGHHTVDFSKAFDVVREYYTTILPLLVAGMHVVEPRSPHCRMALSFGLSGVRDEKTEQVLSLIPKPDVLIWLDTSPVVAHKRIEKRGLDSEKLSDLQMFSSAYRNMPEAGEWIHIQGDKTQRKIEQEIKNHVDAFFTR